VDFLGDFQRSQNGYPGRGSRCLCRSTTRIQDPRAASERSSAGLALFRLPGQDKDCRPQNWSTDGTPALIFTGHDDRGRDYLDGIWLATTSNDGTARTWSSLMTGVSCRSGPP